MTDYIEVSLKQAEQMGAFEDDAVSLDDAVRAQAEMVEGEGATNGKA